jgi:hypothetical protein
MGSTFFSLYLLHGYQQAECYVYFKYIHYSNKISKMHLLRLMDTNLRFLHFSIIANYFVGELCQLKVNLCCWNLRKIWYPWSPYCEKICWPVLDDLGGMAFRILQLLGWLLQNVKKLQINTILVENM